MYKITPYDLSQTFRLIPDKKKYVLTFYRGNSVSFTSRKKAFQFISKLSHLFVETLSLCEMVNNTINTYSFHLKPKSFHVDDDYNIYHKNYYELSELIRQLKFYQVTKVELYQVIMKFDRIIQLIIENCKILNKKNYNCVLVYQIIIEKTSNSLYCVLDNSDYHYKNNSLTLFYKDFNNNQLKLI